MNIYKTTGGYVAVNNNKATNFTQSLKKTKTVGVASGFIPNGTLLSGKSLSKNVLFTILNELK